MILIVGLGNPGKKYIHTRHNLGFRVLDAFAKENNFPAFRLSKKFQAAISEEVLEGQKIILAKPQTFMNESGRAVKKIVSSFSPAQISEKLGRAYGAGKFQVSRIWVVHDDIDLPLGKIRISKARGSAGHKGVESIIKELGTNEFVRIRVGIELSSKCKVQSSKLQFKIQNLEKFVLEKFTKEEEKIMAKVIKRAIKAIGFALRHGVEKAMARFNQTAQERREGEEKIINRIITCGRKELKEGRTVIAKSSKEALKIFNNRENKQAS